MTWLLSRQQCSVAGGDLVVMETKEEWAFITEQIQTKTVPDGSNESFIGMEIPDNWKKGEPLKWKNGANFTLTDKWQSGKPTANEGEQRTSSVLISRDYMFKGSLNSIGYDLQRGRICEYKKDCSQAGRVPRCISPTTETLTTETIAASQLTPSSSATTTTIRTNTKTTESAITTSLSTSLPVILPTSSKSSSALSLEVLVVLVLLSVACIILIIIVCVWKHQHRGMHKDAAQWLVDNRNIKVFGTDTLSLDYGPSSDFPTHVALLPRGIIGIEMVANVEKLPPKGATVFVLPMKIGGGTGAPVRMIATIKEPMPINRLPRLAGYLALIAMANMLALLF
ncbi:predicted protein [Nematostella vectensis]|uniref:C-type lectin domain-containing protein n=1 Tax=Nematostella vectensis TaxID=45351 RepID=A7T233_NEMVE|nr:predicted protein [Nematostella vectensis]|eukprot:XP_001622082.1 predicted protein [Nematostella vectensis]